MVGWSEKDGRRFDNAAGAGEKIKTQSQVFIQVSTNAFIFHFSLLWALAQLNGGTRTSNSHPMVPCVKKSELYRHCRLGEPSFVSKLEHITKLSWHIRWMMSGVGKGTRVSFAYLHTGTV